jgi:preprotein translocase subunit YajC
MKKSFILSLLFWVSFSVITLPGQGVALADEAAQAVSAPAVVAPGQPAQAQVVTSAQPQAAAAAAHAQQPSMLGMAVPFLVMIGIMYFLMIRPQQKKMKEHQTLLTGLKTGDEVVTSAGIIGTIAGMSEKVVTLEVSKNVQLKVLKSQVNQVVKGPISDITPQA